MPNKFLPILAIVIAALVFLAAGSLRAQNETKTDPAPACNIDDRACVVAELRAAADQIDTASWRDQIYRELAKTIAFDGDVDAAIALLDKIENPDTKALTIRGIGFAVADNKLPRAEYDAAFIKLRAAAEKITHPPSYAIALTYIAMAQAFAGDNQGAWDTAADMENDALRHKAYGETAEIQAEHGDFDAAMKSIGYIESEAYRNKAYAITSKLLADAGKLNEALKAAQKISNAYKKASALQYVLDVQKPREVKK